MGTLAFLSQLLLLGLGTFLMIVVLLQRGRGGGLAGAFGGLGGQSAFGTKAGDVFTKITIGIAIAWVVVSGGSGYFLRAAAERRAQGLGEVEQTTETEISDPTAESDPADETEGDIFKPEAGSTGTSTDTSTDSDDTSSGDDQLSGDDSASDSN